ncbi:MAG: TonB family protein [Syntrophaceae bacterium]|nr:TonB family protein [Syntrophaceae bacterium]
MVLIKSEKRMRDEGMKLNNMIVFSFLLHALILSILFFSPSWPTPKWTFGPVYTVDLVSPPSSSVNLKSTDAISEKKTVKSSKEHSIVMKKRIDKISSIPISEIKTRKKEVSGSVDQAIEGIKKKVLSATEETPRPATSSGNAEMSMRMKVYYSMIWSRIKEQWALPRGILPDNNLEAIIDAKILRNGKLTDWNFEKKSGNKYFDESVVKAIKKASPFPPLPEWLDDSMIELGIRFHSSELQ